MQRQLGGTHPPAAACRQRGRAGEAASLACLDEQVMTLCRAARLLDRASMAAEPALSAREALLRHRVGANGLRELDLFLVDIIAAARCLAWSPAQRRHRQVRRSYSAAEAYRRASDLIAIDLRLYRELRALRSRQNALAFAPGATIARDRAEHPRNAWVQHGCAVYQAAALAVLAAAAGAGRPGAAG